MANRMSRILILLIAIFAACPSWSRDWYAAPNARLDGDGSFMNPWALQVALSKSGMIQPGDTLYLRDGRYPGPGFISNLQGASNNYIVVRSFPGEWAIITDGGLGTLAGSVGASTPYATTSGILISGSEFWTPGTIISIDSEQLQINARGNSPTNWTLVRGWNGTTPTIHSAGTTVKIRADFVEHSGGHVMFRDFEITGTATSNRVVNASHYVGCGLNLLASGRGNKAVNLIIHNVGHPAIGFWSQGDGGEINGCVLWGNGIYDNNGSWTRGSGVYSQNEDGLAKIKNIISFRNFTYGAKVYGETGPVKDFQFINNIAFDNADWSGFQLEASSGSSSTSNIWLEGNSVLGAVSLQYASTGNSHQYVMNNTIVGTGLKTAEQINSVYTNNTIFNMKNVVVSELATAENGYRSAVLASNQLNIVWDYNTWYTGDGSSKWAWNFKTADISSGWLSFSNWQAVSGFDTHSAVATNWPKNYLLVRPTLTDYDTNVAHIVVINTDTNATNATLSLAQLGYVQGDQYILRDAQDYFNPIINGTFSNVVINLPLNRTNVAAINGILQHYTNSHSNVKNPGLFNAFVLRRIARSGRPAPATGLRIVGP